MQIENMVVKCSTCGKDRPEPKEPLISTSFPSHPWERLAVNLFELVGKVYLIVAERFYSHFLNMRRGSLHTRSFRCIHPSVLTHR